MKNKRLGNPQPAFPYNILFLLVALSCGLTFLWLTLDGRIGCRDFLDLAIHRYFFLNQAITGHEFPQWVPYVVHGAPTAYSNGEFGGRLQDVLLLISSFLPKINFLTYLNLGFLIDELLLAVGMWLWASRLFQHKLTMAFVSGTVLASSVWVYAPGFNLQIYCAIPLVLYFFHQFLDQGRWRYFLFGMNLLAIQAIGGAPYFFPVSSLVVFLYTVFYCLFNARDTQVKLRRIKFSVPAVISCLLVILSFMIVFSFYHFSFDQITINREADPEGKIGIVQFLSYGGSAGFAKWSALLLGFSSHLDIMLYSGILTVLLVIFYLLTGLKREGVPILVTFIFLLFFSAGGVLTKICYYVWPLMSYYRHVTYTAMIAKVFMIMLAGFGLDRLMHWKFQVSEEKHGKRSLVFMIVLALLMGISFIYVCSSGQAVYDLMVKLKAMTDVFLLRQYHLSNESFYDFILNGLGEGRGQFDEGISLIVCQLTRAAIAALMIGGLLCVLLVKDKIKKGLLITVLVLFHFSDVFGYKCLEMNLRTVKLDRQMTDLFNFHDMSFNRQRRTDLDWMNPRVFSFFKDEALLKVLLSSRWLYSSDNTLLFTDQVNGAFRTDYWPKSFNDYIRAHWRLPLDEYAIPKEKNKSQSLIVFPFEKESAKKISGITKEKIQFFSKAYALSSRDQTAEVLADPQYQGDAIFLDMDQDAEKSYQGVVEGFNKDELSRNDRVILRYEVLEFDANNLKLSVNNDSGQKVWLHYSDSWHPLGKVTINGKKGEIYKSNLAYKAVLLEQGANVVWFRFHSSWMVFLHYVVGINSLLWIIALFVFIVMILREKDTTSELGGKDWGFVFLLASILVIGHLILANTIPRVMYRTDKDGKSNMDYLERLAKHEEVYDEGKVKGGVRVLNRLAQVKSYRAIAWEDLGFCYYASHDGDKALEYYARSIKEEPFFYAAHYDAALVYLQRKEYGAAMEQLKAGVIKLQTFRSLVQNLVNDAAKNGMGDFVNNGIALVEEMNQDEEKMYLLVKGQLSSEDLNPHFFGKEKHDFYKTLVDFNNWNHFWNN